MYLKPTCDFALLQSFDQRNINSCGMTSNERGKNWDFQLDPYPILFWFNIFSGVNMCVIVDHMRPKKKKHFAILFAFQVFQKRKKITFMYHAIKNDDISYFSSITSKKF